MGILAFFGAVLSGSVGAALLNLWWAEWRRKKEVEKATAFAALNLSYVLEDYAYLCVDSAAEHSMHDQSEGHAGSRPGISDFPIPADDYSKLRIDVLDTLFSIPRDVRALRDKVNFIASVAGDYDDADSAIQKGLKELGLKAFQLSVLLREHYNLPARSVGFGDKTLHEVFYGSPDSSV